MQNISYGIQDFTTSVTLQQCTKTISHCILSGIGRSEDQSDCREVKVQKLALLRIHVEVILFRPNISKSHRYNNENGVLYRELILPQNEWCWLLHTIDAKCPLAKILVYIRSCRYNILHHFCCHTYFCRKVICMFICTVPDNNYPLVFIHFDLSHSNG